MFQDKALESNGNHKEILHILPNPTKKNVEVRRDQFRPQRNNIDQGGVKRGVIR